MSSESLSTSIQRDTPPQLSTLLATASCPPGIYRFINRQRSTPILETITDLGFYAGYINGVGVEDKATFLTAIGQAFAFPGYYGKNWDAFNDMITDLSWLNAKGLDAQRPDAKGYVLLYDYVHHFASAQPEAWQTALEILEDAVDSWQSAGIPFYILLRHNWRWNRQLPALAAIATR